jgi:hypothetical protein
MRTVHAPSQDRVEGYRFRGRDRRALLHRLAVVGRVVTYFVVCRGRDVWGDKDIGELARFFRDHMGGGSTRFSSGDPVRRIVRA